MDGFNCRRYLSSVGRSFRGLKLSCVSLMLVRRPFSSCCNTCETLRSLCRSNLVGTVNMSGFCPSELASVYLFGHGVVPRVGRIRAGPFGTRCTTRTGVRGGKIRVRT